jgi:hypothetical protein
MLWKEATPDSPTGYQEPRKVVGCVVSDLKTTPSQERG